MNTWPQQLLATATSNSALSCTRVLPGCQHRPVLYARVFYPSVSTISCCIQMVHVTRATNQTPPCCCNQCQFFKPQNLDQNAFVITSRDRRRIFLVFGSRTLVSFSVLCLSWFQITKGLRNSSPRSAPQLLGPIACLLQL